MLSFRLIILFQIAFILASTEIDSLTNLKSNLRDFSISSDSQDFIFNNLDNNGNGKVSLEEIKEVNTLSHIMNIKI